MDLAELVAGHQTNLFAFLYRLTGDPALAEELMQEVFVRALRAAERYRPQGKVSTWLFAIAANVTRDHWRRRQRNLVDLVGEVPGTAWADPEEEALAAADVEHLRSALLQLPLEQRSALILRYYHDLSYLEIAQALACPVGTVRSRIHNGLERLRRSMREEVSTP